MDSLKIISDAEFEEIKKNMSESSFDDEIKELLLAMIEQKRIEFKTRN